jgi:hypothetical protein
VTIKLQGTEDGFPKKANAGGDPGRRIDAPEKSQPFVQRSKESLSATVLGKEVDVH